MGSFDITFRTRVSLHPGGEPSEYISCHGGVIYYEQDDDQKTRRVGRLRAYRIHAGLAADEGESLFDVCDSHSAEMCELHSLLYEPGGHGFKDGLVHRFDAIEADCLVIDYVILHPHWRRLRLGLLAVRKVADILGGGCGLAVCDIAPLNPDAHRDIGVPESWIPRQRTANDQRRATMTLRRYARTMGFVRLGRSPYYGKRPLLGRLAGASRLAAFSVGRGPSRCRSTVEGRSGSGFGGRPSRGTRRRV